MIRSDSILPLWLGLLTGPVAFLVDLEVSYGAVPWLRASGHKLPLYVSTFVALLLTASAGMAAHRGWRKLRGKTDEDEAEDNARFLALGGVATSALFSLAILALAVPKVGLHLWD
jgi:hypothetical protein